VTGESSVFGLRGRVALVSGGSRGIGRAIAEGLARAGARVEALGRSLGGADGTGVTYRQGDVTEAARFRDVAAQIEAEHGRLDIYVHAAGISLPPGEQSAESERFARTIAVNLVAAYECAISVAEVMAKRGAGSIINVTSINAVMGFPSNPGYVASKGGLSALTRALALDFGPRGVRVNNLVPGYVRTAMTEASYQDPKRRAERAGRTMLGRWGMPEDLVGPAVFLASDAAAYVTGQDLVVDGGWTARGL
jgi:NAD(P)-dependent dehydrogenase (short-subunit alcohol dehydrogenase family)